MKHEVHQVHKKDKLIVTTYVQKMSPFGLNTSSKYADHWSAESSISDCSRLHHTAANVRGLPLPIRNQVNQFRAFFLTNGLFLFLSSSYQKIPESVAKHRSLNGNKGSRKPW